MPNLLSIECSTDACSIALLAEGNEFDRFMIQPRQHNRILLPMIEEVLTEAGISLADIDAFAYGAGPGSFTGLRLAVGVIQGLAFATQKPVIPVSSLRAKALSYAVENASQNHQIIQEQPIIMLAEDARMGDVYFAVYEIKNGTVKALEEDALIPAQTLEQRLIQYPEAICIGSGWQESPICYPRAKEVLQIAQKDFLAGKVFSAEAAKPYYLRDSVSWKKWQSKSAEHEKRLSE